MLAFGSGLPLVKYSFADLDCVTEQSELDLQSVEATNPTGPRKREEGCGVGYPDYRYLFSSAFSSCFYCQRAGYPTRLNVNK